RRVIFRSPVRRGGLASTILHDFEHSYTVVSFFFSSRRRHTSCLSDWSSDVCSSDLPCFASPRSPERFTPIIQSSSRNRSTRLWTRPVHRKKYLAARVLCRMPVTHIQGTLLAPFTAEIGRASCRERVEMAVGERSWTT